MVVSGSACLAAIWTSRRSTPASSMVVTKVWHSMCGCMRTVETPAAAPSAFSPAGSGVPAHACSVAVAQDWPVSAVADSPIDGAADSWRERDEGGLVAFALDGEDAVTACLADCGDVRSGGLEDP